MLINEYVKTFEQSPWNENSAELPPRSPKHLTRMPIMWSHQKINKDVNKTTCFCFCFQFDAHLPRVGLNNILTSSCTLGVRLAKNSHSVNSCQVLVLFWLSATWAMFHHCQQTECTSLPCSMNFYETSSCLEPKTWQRRKKWVGREVWNCEKKSFPFKLTIQKVCFWHLTGTEPDGKSLPASIATMVVKENRLRNPKSNRT